MLIILVLTTVNLQKIWGAMNFAETMAELESMEFDDRLAHRQRYFVAVKDKWAFVEAENLDNIIYGILNLVDA